MNSSTEFKRFPSQWKVLPFLDAFEDITAKGIKIKKENYQLVGDIPIIDQGSKPIGGYTCESNKVVDIDLPAIVFGDHTKVFKLIGEDFAIGADGVKLLKPKCETDKKFLFFYLSQLKLEDAGYSRHYKFLKETYIPLPPLETQKQIAAVLEKADQLRKDCQLMEQELNSLAQSVFIDMFGDPVTNPKGWDTSPCQKLCHKITVGVVVQPASYYVDSGIPALRSLNVRENKLQDDKMMYFSNEVNETVLSKSKIYEGDVLVVRSGQPGRAAVVTKNYDGCNCIDVLIVRPDTSVLDPQYLSFFLNSEGGKKLVLREERGQVQKHLNVKALNEAIIPTPPIEKQREFLGRYTLILKQLAVVQSKKSQTDQLFQSLSTSAFKGDLNLDKSIT